MTTVLVTKTGKKEELYGVYYTVFGSLAGEDQLVKEYFWEGPYTNLQRALHKAEELKLSHQNDDCFIVRTYKG